MYDIPKSNTFNTHIITQISSLICQLRKSPSSKIGYFQDLLKYK